MREKTDSITHLVKIVAGEVFDKKVREKYEYSFDMQRAEETVIASLLGSITSSLKEAGQIWHPEEDQLLIQEVKVAMAQIAKNHNRSKGAIRSRIQQKELI